MIHNTTPRTTIRAIRLIKLSIKHNKLYLDNRRISCREIRKMLKTKNFGFKVDGIYTKPQKHICGYTFNGEKITNRCKNSVRFHILGFKIIKNMLMVKVKDNYYVKFSEIF